MNKKVINWINLFGLLLMIIGAIGVCYSYYFGPYILPTIIVHVVGVFIFVISYVFLD